jgi:hypothetical protein
VSARMRGSPKDVLRCIDALVTALAGAGDFRYRERVVRQLAKTSRWYRSWTRTHRPGSHASSQGYAVTWLWTEYAAGHLDLSPGWSARPPTCGQRALYRRYAARLNPAAASELIAVAQHGSTARPPGGDADGLRRAG